MHLLGLSFADALVGGKLSWRSCFGRAFFGAAWMRDALLIVADTMTSDASKLEIEDEADQWDWVPVEPGHKSRRASSRHQTLRLFGQ